MVKHIWSVLCRRSLVDRETNNISLTEVFEQLGVNVSAKQDGKFPDTVNVPLEFELVSMWHREVPQKHIRAAAKVEIINPEGKIVKDLDEKIEMPPTMRRLRTILKIVGFTVEMSGNYIFRVKFKEEGQNGYVEVAEIPLEVNLTKSKVKNNPIVN